MEENDQKVLIYIGIAVIVLLLIGLGFTFSSNLKNKRNLNSEKLASEKLLSEKLMVEKELEKLKADFSSLTAKSDANAKLLDETNAKIAENQKKINALSGQNRSLQGNKEELEELQKIKADLEKQSAQLKSDKDNLLAQTNDLQNSLASLEADKKDLTLKLENALLYNTDNFLVTATRGKKKEKVVVSYGRWDDYKQKNTSLMLKTAVEFLRVRQDYRFIIFGSGLELVKKLLESEPEEIRRRIEALGFVDRAKIKELLASAQILFMPSRWEGCLLYTSPSPRD